MIKLQNAPVLYWRYLALRATRYLNTPVTLCPLDQCTGMEFTTPQGVIVSLVHSQEDSWQVTTSDTIDVAFTGTLAKAHARWVRMLAPKRTKKYTFLG